MKLFAAGLLVAASVALGVTTANGGAAASAAHHALGAVPRHGSAPHRVVATKKTAGLNCGSSCASYQAAINTFFTNVAAASDPNATNVYSVATQYCQDVATSSTSCNGGGTPIAYSSTFGGSYVDGRAFPASGCSDGVWVNAVHYADKYCLTDAQIQTEIQHAINVNGWPTDSTNIFFLFTPAKVGVCEYRGPATDFNPCTTTVFCAYHSSTQSMIYAVEPDDAQVPDGGCDTRRTPIDIPETPVGFGADATINTISHEQNEAITDPFGDGWKTADNGENGDLCAYNFGASLGGLPGSEYNQVINGTNYFLQQEYSNADGGCIQQPGGTMTPVDPAVGAGPLPYNGGSVMLTNTTHAIYWVPATPTNSHPPKIAGTAKVGKKLKALRGTWSNSPTYAYRWLRCSSAGRSCKGIKKAKDSAYTLTTADIGHRLEVRVTAANQGGKANATSAPTGKVRP